MYSDKSQWNHLPHDERIDEIELLDDDGEDAVGNLSREDLRHNFSERVPWDCS